MKKFEYHLEHIAVDIKVAFKENHLEAQQLLSDKLSELGEKGWRLCGVNGFLYYFAREKGQV